MLYAYGLDTEVPTPMMASRDVGANPISKNS